MTRSYGEAMDRLLEELAKLPGVGRRTAERLAHHLLRLPADEAMKLAIAIRDVKRNTRSCSRCGNVTEIDPCAICGDATRDQGSVCVVEQPRDVVSIEAASAWRGVYHVLGGKVSPLDGVGAEDLNLARLVERVRTEGVREVVLATSPDLEGDGTALYVEKALEGLPVRVERIARGVPTGIGLENASTAMLQDAFKGRR
ncbi:MAG: Recombination protein RecR [Planctomycetes bacterium]|nr:Recombination protein RecR [Planctomycetota bacterium]